jgi:hypothetical protein
MKKLVLLLLLTIISFQNSNSQIRNSVLATGEWFKFSVDTTGVFKIDREFLERTGISTQNLNPKKIHIYGNGGNLLPELNSDFRYEDLQENAIFIKGEEDEIFNNDDYILFYAKGPHDWTVDLSRETASHNFNIYSDESYYFLTVNEADGKRIQNETSITENTNNTITTFDDFIFYEKDERNLIGAGTQWFFNEDLNIENTKSFKLLFPNAVADEEIKVTTRAVTTSSRQSNLSVSVNNEELYQFNLGIALGLNQASAISSSGSIKNSSSEIDISLTYNSNGNPAASTFLDYIEITGKKNLIAGNNQFSFRSFNQANALTPVNFQIENSNSIFQVWDVTNYISPKNIINQSNNNSFSFVAEGGSLNEYIVLNERDFFTPTLIEDSRVENQNLHGLQNINYLIITNELLTPQAQRLADYHSQNSNLVTQVVTLDKIYNEFASGSKDITGIRDFIKYLYDNSSEEDVLKYVCFFGDSSYDYKDRIPDNNNIVPVKLATNSFNLAFSYVTDDYYVMLEEEEGSMSSLHTIDVASSRIPVSSLNQAKEVVDKILNYYSSSTLGDWRNTVTLLADDIDDPTSDNRIQEGVEIIADQIKEAKPIYNVDKIYADAFLQENSAGGERYPEVNEAINNAIEKGTLLFDYFGHGGEDGFAQERILERGQIQSYNNFNTLPLLITVTCDFSRFDNPSRITAGELTFWNKNGGAASMITTTREVFIGTGQSFNSELIKVLLEFDDEDLTIAESLAEVKNGFFSNQKFFIFCFGDPAMELAIPEPNIVLTKMNENLITESLDTLKALSKVTLEGIITDETNNKLENFNGTLSTIVFDKIRGNTTLDNDGHGIFLDFDTQESKLFRGKSTIENGSFKFDFIVPKDIRVAFGKSKLSFYAQSQDNSLDKNGFNLDIVVGGIDENAPEDTIGPEIQLFLNDESFIDGGNTNVSPNLIVKLEDMSGINTSVSSLGHNIVAILDGDINNQIVLNDFYQTEENDFTKGKVNFTLRDLEVGEHTLQLKAWDTYNNSSEATLTFVVVSDTFLNLENVLNYPNPFVNYTEFWFNHNKPNENLDVQIQIFTVSGKLVKSIHQSVVTNGNLSRTISWNGLDDFGKKIGKGVYIYKLKVTATESNLVSEKYEKLVIL